VPQVLCPVLVGRDEEAGRLRAALAAAGTGCGSTVFLAGEAGIGKSRLVREVVRTAGESGLTVLAGRAVAGGAPTPFRPFAEALTSAGRAGRLPASEELGPFRPVLGRLIPEWRPPQPVPGEETPVFLGEAVLRLLRVLAPQAGCMLVLEDLHWADQETLALLEYLADNLAAERVLCLATLREEGGEAAALASALAARGSAAMLALGRLDPAAMADMARACLDAAHLPSAVHEFVAGRAEGIPFLVEEVLAGLVGEGALTERDGRWHAADLSTPGVPATFADAIRRRLDGMRAESRRVIGAAAVLGRRFDWALLGPVTGLTGAAVVGALREGTDLQLVVAERDGFRFRHALTHEAVLAGLLPG
jgi:predicted ATPase